MYERRVILIIALICSLPIISARPSNAQQQNSSNQSSSAAIDRQKSDEVRMPLGGGSFAYKLSEVIIRDWEKIVDAAGLHSLLNENQKAYTVFKPDFKKMEWKQVFKLFKIENQADLQKVVKCHVVPQKILLKDLPNDKEVTLQTMEPGCTITVRAQHFQRAETKEVAYTSSSDYSTVSCSWGECRRSGGGIGGTTKSVPTGKMLDFTKLAVNGVNLKPANNSLSELADINDNRKGFVSIFRIDSINKGFGNYIEYSSIESVLIPLDLKSKYVTPTQGRPLTD